MLPKALTRFRMAWAGTVARPSYKAARSMHTGYVQPTREQMIAKRGTRTIFHSNAITTWSISDKGEVKHVYA